MVVLPELLPAILSELIMVGLISSLEVIDRSIFLRLNLLFVEIRRGLLIERAVLAY